MLESISPKPEPQCDDRLSTGWRSVIAAWVLVAMFVPFVTGAAALASHRVAPPAHLHHVGVVIPRHDPASMGIGVPCASSLGECAKSAAAIGPAMEFAYPLW